MTIYNFEACTRDLCASLLQRADGVGIDVEDHNAAAVLEQVPGHVRAHVAEPNEADGLAGSGSGAHAADESSAAQHGCGKRLLHFATFYLCAHNTRRIRHARRCASHPAVARASHAAIAQAHIAAGLAS